MTRIILHVETDHDGLPGWWADGPDHNYTAAGWSLEQVKGLVRDSCTIEGWPAPEWELCPCTQQQPCTVEGADDGPAE